MDSIIQIAKVNGKINLNAAIKIIYCAASDFTKIPDVNKQRHAVTTIHLKFSSPTSKFLSSNMQFAYFHYSKWKTFFIPCMSLPKDIQQSFFLFPLKQKNLIHSLLTFSLFKSIFNLQVFTKKQFCLYFK